MPPNHLYETIRQQEHNSDDNLTDDSVAPEESVLHHVLLSVRRDLAFLIASGAVIILSFVLGSLLHPVSLSKFDSSNHHHQDHHPQGQDGLRSLVPDFSVETKTFEFNKTFAGDPSEEVAAAWASLIPKGQGVVHLPIRNELDTETHNIAAFHTLHCLYTMRESFFTLYQMSANEVVHSADETKHMLKHGRHCFEYIRQSLMCNPDLTLEPVKLEEGQLKTWGVERQCRNFRELSEWAREMRSSDNQGILT